MSEASVEAAARRLQERGVPAGELASIAATFPALRAAVAAHPDADEQTRGWIASAVGAEAVAADRRERSRTRRPVVVTFAAAVVAAIAVVGLVAVWLGTPARPAASPEPVERGFDTPQAAAAYVYDHIAAGDFAGAGEAFATTSAVEGYSFEAYTEWMKGATAVAMLPADRFRAIDVGMREGQVARALRTTAWCLALPDQDVLRTMPVADRAAADRAAADLDTSRLAGLKVVRADVLWRDDDGARAAQVRHFHATLWGATDYQEVGVLLDTPSGAVMGGVELLEYRGRWYVHDFGSSRLGVSGGVLQPTTTLGYLGSLASIGIPVMGS